MVGMLKRMRHLKGLLDIRLGPGAMVMSNDVQKIHMSFAVKINDGHFGPRKFWHLYLPRLKYHNPAVPMHVTRTEDQAAPATLTIFYNAAMNGGPTQTNPTEPQPRPIQHSPQTAPIPGSNTTTTTTKSPTTSSPPSSPDGTPAEANAQLRTQSINMKHKHWTDILAEFTRAVDGKQVEATPEDEQALEELKEARSRSERDAKVQKEVLRKRRREQAILEQARRSVEAGPA